MIKKQDINTNNDISKIICDTNLKLISFRNRHGKDTNNNTIYDECCNRFFVPILLEQNDKYEFVDYSEFVDRMSMSTCGYYQLFGGNYLFGDLIYDILHKRNKNLYDYNELIILRSINENDNSNYVSYLTYLFSDEKFDVYTNGIMKFKISQKTYENIYDAMFAYGNYKKCVCFDGLQILMHPECFSKYLLGDCDNIDHNIPNITKIGNNSIHVKLIVCNDIEQFRKTIDFKNIDISFSDDLYNICLFLERYEFIEVLLTNRINPPSNTIFDAIKNNKVKYIELLVKYKINVDVLNSDGLSSIEYASTLYIIDQSCYKIICILNQYKYTRNPKWWDCINSIRIFNLSIQTEFDNTVQQTIKENNVTTMIALNNCILKSMIKHNMCYEIRNFVKKNIKYIDIHNLLQDILSLHNTMILHFIESYIPITDELILTYFDLQMYETIVKFKNRINLQITFKHLIDKCDVKGIVFVFEYIGQELSQYILENGDTLLHRLCRQQEENDEYAKTKQIKCFKILAHYFPNSINMKNHNNETPIFCSCFNSNLSELLLNDNIDIKHTNYIGDTYIHNIIRYSSINVLSRVVMCKNINNNNMINCINNEHETAIVLACKLQKVDIVNLLLNCEADKTIYDCDGNSIYHYIGLNNLKDVRITEFPEIQNKYGYTPSDYVLQNIYNKAKNVVK
jgi:hypothetical protein